MERRVSNTIQERASSVKLCNLQYIPHVKIALFITFLCSARMQ